MKFITQVAWMRRSTLEGGSMHSARRRKPYQLAGRKNGGRQLLHQALGDSSALNLGGYVHQDSMQTFHFVGKFQRIKIESESDPCLTGLRRGRPQQTEKLRSIWWIG
jgi:hypothetical protein